MSWLLIKTFFKKSYVWLKHNWKVPLLAVWTITVYVISRNNTESLKDVISANKKAHREEIEVLNRVHADEVLKLKNLHSQYEQTISQLRDEFSKEQRELTEKQVQDVKAIVIKSQGQPEEIIRKIEDDFGIKFKN